MHDKYNPLVSNTMKLVRIFLLTCLTSQVLFNFFLLKNVNNK